MRYKTALITGAARGIGLATTQLMTARGYRVAMVDRDVDELNAVVTSLDQAEAFFCDVSVPCLLYTSPSPRDLSTSRMPSSA